MSQQLLGKKKLDLCRKFAGVEYTKCMVRGNSQHFVATCVHPNGLDFDWVDYKTGEVEPYLRQGVPDGKEINIKKGE